MDQLAAHKHQRAMRALTLNAAELLRHPGATNQERDDAERAVTLARLGHLTIADAHTTISTARATIRQRWAQAA